ncbi:hypothetical protein PFLG_02567, partial [Plasmodium falciparum RAJ116]
MIWNNIKNFIQSKNDIILYRTKPLYDMNIRYMKNKRRGLKEQPRKKPLDIEKKIRNPYKYEEGMHFDNLSKGELYLPESCKGKKPSDTKIIIDDLIDEIIERIDEFDPKSLTNIINSFSKLNYKNDNKYILWKKCIEAVKKLDKEFNFLEIVLITNALCKEHIIKIKNKDNEYLHIDKYNNNNNNNNNNICTHLCEVIKYKIYEEKCLNVHTNAFLLCTVAHSLSKVKYYEKDLFHFIIEYFSHENNYISLDNQHFSQLIYSSYIFNIDKPEFINMFIK